MIFWKKQSYSEQIRGKSEARGVGREFLGKKNTMELFGLIEMSYILIVVVVTQLQDRGLWEPNIGSLHNPGN